MTTLTMLDMDRNPPGRHRRNQASGLSTHERFSTGEHNAEQRSPYFSVIIFSVIIIIINKVNNSNNIKKEKINHLKGKLLTILRQISSHSRNQRKDIFFFKTRKKKFKINRNTLFVASGQTVIENASNKGEYISKLTRMHRIKGKYIVRLSQM